MLSIPTVFALLTFAAFVASQSKPKCDFRDCGLKQCEYAGDAKDFYCDSGSCKGTYDCSPVVSNNNLCDAFRCSVIQCTKTMLKCDSSKCAGNYNCNPAISSCQA